MSSHPVESLEEVLDRAVQDLRQTPTPQGPSPMLIERSRQALGERSATHAGPWGRRAGRWAAVALIASAVGAAIVGGRSMFNRLAPGPVAIPISTDRPAAAPLVLAGEVKLEGVMPVPSFLPKNGGPNCGHHHAPPQDESIVVGAGGGLANVVVAISGGLPGGKAFHRPEGAAVLDQKDCKYLPRMVVMQVGQELVAKNSDPFFHNVHTNSLMNKPVNIAQPQPDPVGKKLKSIQTAETFKVTCDLHPWMIAWVAAFDHPYYGVTDENGRFAIPALPPGQYTLKAWHERLGAIEQEIVIGADGKLPAVQFEFGPERLAAALADRAPTADAGSWVRPDCCK